MSGPYYDDGVVQLWHGDCRELTAWLSADVLVTDPPFGTEGSGGYASGITTLAGSAIVRRSTKTSLTIAGDRDTAVRDEALALWGDDRLAVVFGSPILQAPPRSVQALVYAKPPDAGAAAPRGGWRRDVELIYLCGPWPIGAPERSSVLHTGARSSGNPSGLGARYGHGHAKPVDVMEALIGACPPGTIADSFAGSGSTLIAARNLGRRAIGVEIEERYCEIAARRLAQVFDLYADTEVTA